MSNILDSFKSKKGKKQWDNLPDESKIITISAAIQEKYGKVMAQEIAKGIITGGELECERIYNSYVIPIDALEIGSIEWMGQIDVLLSYLRIKHLNYVSKQIDKSKEEGENT